MRKLFAILSFALAASILAMGAYGEYVQTQAYEPLLEPGYYLLGAVILSSVIFLVSYFLWPKRTP